MAITAKGLNKLGYTAGTDFILEDNGGTIVMTWLSGDARPTDSAIETAHTQWVNDYSRAREAAYPSIGDQLDMLWHAVDTGDWTAAKVKTTEFYTALKAVKDANPKP